MAFLPVYSSDDCIWAGPDIDYLVTPKSSATAIAPNETVLTPNSYFDIWVSSSFTFTLKVFSGGIEQNIQSWIGDRFQIRVLLPTVGPFRVDIEMEFDGGFTRSHTFYLGQNSAVPEGQQIEGLTIGAKTELLNSVSYEAVETLEANNNEVTITMGAAPQRASTLTSVTLTIYRRPDGSHVSSAAFTDDSLKGIATVSASNLPSGLYTARSVYKFSNPDDNWIEEVDFEVKAPDVAPFDSVLVIFPTNTFLGDSITLTRYSDHRATCTRQWLDVGGREYDLPLESGTITFSRSLESLGVTTPSSPVIQFHATFSDRVPDTSSSDSITINVSAIPDETLFNDAIADPGNNAEWQSVLDNPLATEQQKAVAQSAIDFNAEIDGAVLRNDPLVPQMQADRNIWLQETNGDRTFGQWWHENQNVASSQEIAQARGWVTEAPTSSIEALVNYFGQFVAYGSGEYILQSGSIATIRDIQAHGVPDVAILTTYQNYQANIAKGSALFRFDDYLKGARN